MKITIVIPIFASIFSVASAQTTTLKTLLEIVKEKPQALPFVFTDVPKQLPQTTLLSTSPQEMIYTLPQDNMPCVVLGKDKCAVMPNAKPFAVSGNIPNASNVHTIIPKKLFLGPIVIPKRPTLKHVRSRCGMPRAACDLPAI